MKKIKKNKLSEKLIPLHKLNEIKLERELLENCYICFEEITHTNTAVFVYKCRHSICIACLELLSKSKSREILENSSFCGICRAQPNKFVMRTKHFITMRHNSHQNICIPCELIENNKNNHPHCDLLQKMIVQGYK